MSRGQKELGFTLIEMIVALLIVGVMMGIGVMGINAITNAKLKEEAARMAAVIRACYSLAALNGRTYRIVFDLDAGTYTPEWTENPVVLSEEREVVMRDGARFEEKEDPKKKRGSSGLLGLGAATPRLPKPGWHKVEQTEIGLVDGKDATIKISKDILIDGVFTTHQSDVIGKGKAEMHFFPQGWAERAIIYLKERGKSGEFMSVDVDPLSGRAFVSNGAIKIPPEDMDDRGKEEEGEAIF